MIIAVLLEDHKSFKHFNSQSQQTHFLMYLQSHRHYSSGSLSAEQVKRLNNVMW